jgi:hypothetical protein
MNNKPKLETNRRGDKYWILNEVYHREDGPAVEWIDGGKEWLINGEYHREDGPAIETSSGSKEWYINGELHRIDGPAAEYYYGQRAWFLKGKEYTYEEWFSKLTPEQQYNYLWNIDVK